MNNRATSLLQPGIFRLFLAILVLVNHSSRFDLGDWAVYTFFILSGYWIYRMWEEKYSKARAPYRLSICSRILRILPRIEEGKDARPLVGTCEHFHDHRGRRDEQNDEEMRQARARTGKPQGDRSADFAAGAGDQGSVDAFPTQVARLAEMAAESLAALP